MARECHDQYPSIDTDRNSETGLSALARDGVYAGVIELNHFGLPDELDLISVVAEGSAALVLGFLLVLRLNRGYERWWEARSLWGTLVNVSRNLAVKVRELVGPNAQERSHVRTLIVGFPYGLKDHLRDGSELQKVPGFSETESRPQHVPSFIAARLYEMFNRWKRAGQISGEELWVLDREARELLEICGACEKIKTTPVAQSYRTLVRHALLLVLLAAPWALDEKLGWFNVPATFIASALVLALEGIATKLEDPFGTTQDDLQLERICGTIDSSVSEILEAETVVAESTTKPARTRLWKRG